VHKNNALIIIIQINLFENTIILLFFTRAEQISDYIVTNINLFIQLDKYSSRANNDNKDISIKAAF
jgi:hypothetical protein